MPLDTSKTPELDKGLFVIIEYQIM